MENIYIYIYTYVCMNEEGEKNAGEQKLFSNVMSF